MKTHTDLNEILARLVLKVAFKRFGFRWIYKFLFHSYLLHSQEPALTRQYSINISVVESAWAKMSECVINNFDVLRFFFVLYASDHVSSSILFDCVSTLSAYMRSLYWWTGASFQHHRHSRQPPWCHAGSPPKRHIPQHWLSGTLCRLFTRLLTSLLGTKGWIRSKKFVFHLRESSIFSRLHFQLENFVWFLIICKERAIATNATNPTCVTLSYFVDKPPDKVEFD